MMRSSVDLPEPHGPSSAVRPPSGTSSDTSSSAVKSPNCLEIASASILTALPPSLDPNIVISSSTAIDSTASSVASA